MMKHKKKMKVGQLGQSIADRKRWPAGFIRKI